MRPLYSEQSYRFGIRLKEKEVIDLSIELKKFRNYNPKKGYF